MTRNARPHPTGAAGWQAGGLRQRFTLRPIHPGAQTTQNRGPKGTYAVGQCSLYILIPPPPPAPVTHQVPTTMEIVFVKRTKYSSQYPGIYLFTTMNRFLRPVHNISCDSKELIGTFEQAYLNIAVTMKEAYPGVSAKSRHFISKLALILPWHIFKLAV